MPRRTHDRSPSPAGMRAQPFQLRAEDHIAGTEPVVQRLLTYPVTDEVERTLRPIPQRDCEHADHASESGLDAPAPHGGQEYLGVRVAAPRWCAARRVHLRANRLVIIDLAVERERPAPVHRAHRLMSLGGEIDDGEPSMAKPDPRFGVGPGPRVVGPAVRHRVGHRLRGFREQVGWGAPQCPQSGDAAH